MNYKVVKFLFEEGADVNQAAKEEDDWTELYTPLMVACSTYSYRFANFNSNKRNIIKLLMEKGADKTLKNKDGKTALDISREEKLRSRN